MRDRQFSCGRRQWTVRLRCRSLLTAAWMLATCQMCAAPLPDASRLTSIRAVLEAPAEDSLQEFKIRGSVTRVSREITLQDQTGAIEVEPGGTVLAEIGDEIEVTGHLQVHGDVRALTGASVQNLWHSSPPPPLALQPDEAANGEHLNALVQVEGRLLRVTDEAGSIRLQLEGGHQFFTAALVQASQLSPGERDRMLALPVNSVVRLVGVLSVQSQEYSATGGSFRLLLRHPSDVDMTKGPPWGTTTHIVELIAVLLALGAALQSMHVRMVRRQFRAVLAERARIARDVHDTLAQGFAGIALQLEVVRGGMVHDPAGSEANLRTALGMVRHCRAEAHRSISSLRAFSQAMPLDAMLRELVAGMTGAAGAQVRLDLQELGSEPPQIVAEQIFRICQEAVSNAVQHSSASNITVTLRRTRGALEFNVWDDGVGFDVGAASSQQTDHFGILGMRERAAQLGARWTLTSGPGSTRVGIVVPEAKARLRARRGWLATIRKPVVPWKKEEIA